MVVPLLSSVTAAKFQPRETVAAYLLLKMGGISQYTRSTWLAELGNIAISNSEDKINEHLSTATLACFGVRYKLSKFALCLINERGELLPRFPNRHRINQWINGESHRDVSRKSRVGEQRCRAPTRPSGIRYLMRHRGGAHRTATRYVRGDAGCERHRLI
jgi:hypothetical protein